MGKSNTLHLRAVRESEKGDREIITFPSPKNNPRDGEYVGLEDEEVEETEQEGFVCQYVFIHVQNFILISFLFFQMGAVDGPYGAYPRKSGNNILSFSPEL